MSQPTPTLLRRVAAWSTFALLSGEMLGATVAAAAIWDAFNRSQPAVAPAVDAGVFAGAFATIVAGTIACCLPGAWRRARRLTSPFAGRVDASPRGPRRDLAMRPAGQRPSQGARDDEVAAYLALSQAIDDHTGSTYDLLTDVANALGVTLAYVDRASVEAYLDTDLDPQQWAAVTDATQAMDFDRWIGDSSGERGEFITHQLRRARELHPDAALPEVTPW